MRLAPLVLLVACKAGERSPPVHETKPSIMVRDASTSGATGPVRHQLDLSQPEIGDPPPSMVRVPWGVIGEPDLYIDRTEVTIGAYRECVVAGACKEPELCASAKTWSPKGHDNYPVTCVGPEQALAYCGFRGKRLPTSAEWLRAAVGDDSRKFPWGDSEPTCALAVLENGPHDCAEGGLAPVGSRPRGTSPWGALDMIGNVAEIVNHDLSGKPKRARWIYLGGAWDTQVVDVAKSITDMSWGAAQSDDIGFRCARRAGEKPSGWIVVGE